MLCDVLSSAFVQSHKNKSFLSVFIFVSSCLSSSGLFVSLSFSVSHMTPQFKTWSASTSIICSTASSRVWFVYINVVLRQPWNRCTKICTNTHTNRIYMTKKQSLYKSNKLGIWNEFDIIWSKLQDWFSDFLKGILLTPSLNKDNHLNQKCSNVDSSLYQTCCHTLKFLCNLAFSPCFLSFKNSFLTAAIPDEASMNSRWIS